MLTRPDLPDAMLLWVTPVLQYVLNLQISNPMNWYDVVVLSGKCRIHFLRAPTMRSCLIISSWYSAGEAMNEGKTYPASLLILILRVSQFCHHYSSRRLFTCCKACKPSNPGRRCGHLEMCPCRFLPLLYFCRQFSNNGGVIWGDCHVVLWTNPLYLLRLVYQL